MKRLLLTLVVGLAGVIGMSAPASADVVFLPPGFQPPAFTDDNGGLLWLPTAYDVQPCNEYDPYCYSIEIPVDGQPGICEVYYDSWTCHPKGAGGIYRGGHGDPVPVDGYPPPPGADDQPPVDEPEPEPETWVWVPIWDPTYWFLY